MAAPITHIVLSKKIFKKIFKSKAAKDFYIGTSFPDIRYLKVIERNKTHNKNLRLSDLEKENSFFAGYKFHSILDQVREEFIIQNKIYSLCPKSKYIATSLKIVEDQIFYRYIKNWDKYINYFNTVLPEELTFEIAKKDIQKWHSILQKYFQQQPNKKTISNFMRSLNFDEETIKQINKNISNIQSNKKIIDSLNELYRDFDLLIR